MDALDAVERQYEEFEPSIKEVEEEKCNTILVLLRGLCFKKNQLRVQVMTNHRLKISGERPLGKEKWSRFQKEIQISENCDINGIKAKFVGDVLYIRQPKVITPGADPHTRTSRDGQEHALQQVISSIARIPDPKQTIRLKDDDWKANTKNDVSQTNTPQKEKEKDKEKQSDATNSSADVKNASQNDIKHEDDSHYADSSDADEMNGADRDDNYNQDNSYLVMEMKKRRKLFRNAMAVLILALLFGLYASWIVAYKK